MDYMRIINMSIVAVYALTMLVLAPTMSPTVAMVGFISAATIFIVGFKVDKGIRGSKSSGDVVDEYKSPDPMEDALSKLADKYRQEAKDVRWAVGVDQFGKIVTEHVNMRLIEGPVKGQWINADKIVFEHIKRDTTLKEIRFQTKTGEYSDIIKGQLVPQMHLTTRDTANIDVALELQPR